MQCCLMQFHFFRSLAIGRLSLPSSLSLSPSLFSQGPSAPPFLDPPFLSAALYFYSPPAQLCSHSPPRLLCIWSFRKPPATLPWSSVTDTDSFRGEEEGRRVGGRRVRVTEHGFASPRTKPQDIQAGNPGAAGQGEGGEDGDAGAGVARGRRSEVARNGWGAGGPGRGGGARGRKAVRTSVGTGHPGPGAGTLAGAGAGCLGRGGAGGGGLLIWVSAVARPAPATDPGSRCLPLLGGGLRLDRRQRPRAPGSANFAMLVRWALSLTGKRVCGDRGCH